MISENLCKLQEQQGESNYRLAKTLGVSQTTIANWRSGKSRPLPVYVHLLAEHYGISEEQLKEGSV